MVLVSETKAVFVHKLQKKNRTIKLGHCPKLSHLNTTQCDLLQSDLHFFKKLSYCEFIYYPHQMDKWTLDKLSMTEFEC